MKAEINQRIVALLDNPEIEAVRVEVRTAFEVYRDERDKDVKIQLEAWDKEERPAPLQNDGCGAGNLDPVTLCSEQLAAGSDGSLP